MQKFEETKVRLSVEPTRIRTDLKKIPDVISIWLENKLILQAVYIVFGPAYGTEYQVLRKGMTPRGEYRPVTLVCDINSTRLNKTVARTTASLHEFRNRIICTGTATQHGDRTGVQCSTSSYSASRQSPWRSLGVVVLLYHGSAKGSHGNTTVCQCHGGIMARCHGIPDLHGRSRAVVGLHAMPYQCHMLVCRCNEWVFMAPTALARPAYVRGLLPWPYFPREYHGRSHVYGSSPMPIVRRSVYFGIAVGVDGKNGMTIQQRSL